MLLVFAFSSCVAICSPFPSSLRFLIQQHLELLHTLQDRVLKCQWQGIMGDVFMKLASKEVKHKKKDDEKDERKKAQPQVTIRLYHNYPHLICMKCQVDLLESSTKHANVKFTLRRHCATHGAVPDRLMRKGQKVGSCDRPCVMNLSRFGRHGGNNRKCWIPEEPR